ncbi:MAG: phosphatidate cytidylyltransferase [Bacteroidales bacterium]|jgi:phosphatidate cytidylyltransferase|nr:phosphatidate cytidylyltransferase [Bacteroidales bacterium]
MTTIVKRTITGAIYVLSVIVAICIHPIVCSAYFGIISIIGLFEFYHNSKKIDIHPNEKIGFLIAIITYLTITICNSCDEVLSGSFISAIVFLSVLTFIVELFKKTKTAFTNISYTFMGVIYVVVPLALTYPILETNGDFSPMILMSVFIFAWCNDTFAYLSGMKFGKHKLFERISPKKTWEGSIGGLIAVIIATIIVSYFSKALPWYDFLAFGIITSVVGTFGDLVESMFKRQIGVKDSGNILPGHGGILDRFDILLIDLPIIYIYLLIRTQIF